MRRPLRNPDRNASLLACSAAALLCICVCDRSYSCPKPRIPKQQAGRPRNFLSLQELTGRGVPCVRARQRRPHRAHKAREPCPSLRCNQSRLPGRRDRSIRAASVGQQGGSCLLVRTQLAHGLRTSSPRTVRALLLPSPHHLIRFHSR